MRKQLVILSLFALCTMLVFAQQAMNNEGVTKLIKAGMSEGIIVSTINSSPGTYDTTADGLIALKTAGASDKIIAAVLMKAAGASSVVVNNTAPANDQSPAVQEPEQMGKVFYLDPSTQTFKAVPAERWKRQVKPGWDTVKTLDIVAGLHSSLRISSGDKVVFVYHPLPDQQISNIMQKFQVWPFEADHDQRICIVAEKVRAKEQGNPGVILLEPVKYGSSSFALSPPDGHLKPGEYWLSVPGVGGINDPIITFGVD
jgi:hypothetical protein